MTAIIYALVCLVLIAIDQGIKLIVAQYLEPIEYVNVIDNVLRFRYVENTGAVFGSFADHTLALTIFSIVLVVFVIVYLAKNKNQSKFIDMCLLLLLSGGLGNIIDRIRLHYVIDYIEPLFVNFAVFNFADCLVTVGAFALIIRLIYEIVVDYKNEKKQKVTEMADGTD